MKILNVCANLVSFSKLGNYLKDPFKPAMNSSGFLRKICITISWKK